MSTKLLFMESFDTYTAHASVVSVSELEDRLDVVLDQTCFYPRGGGQDYDQGVITAGEAVFQVSEVRLDDEGVVHHYGVFESGAFDAGVEVEAAVDQDRRLLNTRLHSAGHLIDMAVDELGYDWVPGKGAHYPHMSNVEYTPVSQKTVERPSSQKRPGAHFSDIDVSSDTSLSEKMHSKHTSGKLGSSKVSSETGGGSWNADDKDTIIADINRLISAYVEAGGTNEIRFMPPEEMGSICRHVPDNLPTNKPARVVVYRGDFGVPCGGTHVKDLSQVGGVTVDRIKKKNGNIRVSYSLNDA